MNTEKKRVRAAARTLDVSLKRLGKHPTVRAVHTGRESARKLGDTVRAFGSKLPLVKEEAAHLKDACGAVRDLHVSGVRKGSRLAKANAKLKKSIVGWKHTRAKVETEIHGLGKVHSPKKLLRRRLRKLAHRIDALPRKLPAKQAHRLRVKAKRARTMLTLVNPKNERLLERLLKAEKVLGTLHDLDAGLRTRGPRQKLLRDVKPALKKLRREL